MEGILKLAIGSDFHQEKNVFQHLDFDADVVILAGDINHALQGVEYAKSLKVPTIYVPGNHEFEGAVLHPTIKAMKDAARGSSVHVLYNDVVEIDGVSFAGTTLWTDFVYGGMPPDLNMFTASRKTHDFSTNQERTIIYDFTSIESSPGVTLTPSDVLAEYEICRDFLLNTGVNADVLVTHFAPCTLSAKSGRPRSDQYAFYYVVNFDMPIAYGNNKLIVHGHTHQNVDYMIGDKRVVAHMHGYRSGIFEYKIVEI